MRLAKERIDIGLYTTNGPQLREFWHNQIGLPFDHLLPVRKGQKQYRYHLLGSVLKINELAAPIPDRPPSGYRELLIAVDAKYWLPRPLARRLASRWLPTLMAM